MKNYLLLLAPLLLLTPETAAAQCTGVFPANTLCGNNTGSPKVPGKSATIGTSGAVIPLLNGNNTASGNNTYSGTSQFSGSSYFGSGRPWFDIRSTAQSCAAAVGDGSTDDTTAIQCHINYVSANFGGGTVYFPPGQYKVSGGGVTVPAGIWLIGSSATNTGATTLQVSTDSKVVSFQTSGTTCPGGNHYGGMEKISVFGFNDAGATKDTVYIGDNCNVTIKDSIIWFGANGLKNKGVDSLVFNSFIWGYTAALDSQGANWYTRVKFDDPIGHASTYGYKQGASISGLTTAENTFVQCDFTGTYTDSVLIDDTDNSTVTKFMGSTFSSPFIVTKSRYVQVVAGEFGSATFTMTAGTLTMAASVGLTAITITGAGTRSCAANANITC